MANPALTPEVKKDLLDNMTRATILWTEDLMKGYFDDPHDSMAQQMILEAFAAALAKMARLSPTSTAITQTFIHELQERLNKEQS